MHNNLHQHSTYYVHRTGESNANFKQIAGRMRVNIVAAHEGSGFRQEAFFRHPNIVLPTNRVGRGRAYRDSWALSLQAGLWVSLK